VTHAGTGSCYIEFGGARSVASMWTFSPIPITRSALIMNRRSRYAPTRNISVRAAAPGGLDCSNERGHQGAPAIAVTPRNRCLYENPNIAIAGHARFRRLCLS